MIRLSTGIVLKGRGLVLVGGVFFISCLSWATVSFWSLYMGQEMSVYRTPRFHVPYSLFLTTVFCVHASSAPSEMQLIHVSTICFFYFPSPLLFVFPVYCSRPIALVRQNRKLTWKHHSDVRTWDLKNEAIQLIPFPNFGTTVGMSH